MLNNNIEEEFLNDSVEEIHKKRKNKINSKIKGSNSEREICKILNNRFVNKAVFNRTFYSGAYLGNTNTERGVFLTEEQKELLIGDIRCNNPFWRFSIEVKSRKEFNFFDLFSSKSEINNWIKQIEFDSKKLNRVPLLIIKINGHEPFVLVKEKLCVEFIWGDYSIMTLKTFLTFSDSYFFND